MAHNKRKFDSAFLLSHNAAQIDESAKRHRKDIEASLGFVGDSTKLPKIHDYMKTAIRLTETVADFHTITLFVPKTPGDYSALMPITQTLPRHKINPFSFSPAQFADLGVKVDRVFDDLYEKQLQPDSDLSVAKILGSVQRAMFLSSVIDSSTLAPVYDRGTIPLRCRFCNISLFEGGRLFTVAEEQGRACCHPKRGQNVAWPVDEKTGRHPFSSRPTAVEGEREGDAICLHCLYERVIMADGVLKECLVQWHTFELLMMDNAGDIMEVEPADDDSEKVALFCSCQYQNRGAICLFRFSFVTGQKSYIDANFQPSPDDQTIQERAESKGFATYDTADYERLNAIYRGVCFEQTPLSPKSEEARHQDLVNRINNLSSLMLNGPVNNIMDLSDPTKALEFVLSAGPTMEKYYTAMNTLVKHQGNQIMIMRDSPEQSVEICDCCGGYGHASSKMCNLRTDPSITPRAGKKLGDHFAENISLDSTNQVAALEKTIELHRWENTQLTHLFQDLSARKANGQLARRNAPSKIYLTRCEAGKGRTRKYLKATPSISMETFASLTPEEALNSIHVDMFNSRADTLAIRDAWTTAGFDTSDFDMNEAWQEYASAQGLDKSNVDDAAKIEALYTFVCSKSKAGASADTQSSSSPSTSSKSESEKSS